MTEQLDSTIYRPWTIWSAGLLEQTARKNDRRGKGPWETVEPYKLVAKIDEEFAEVKEACGVCCAEENRTAEAISHLRDELSDLAATCYMLAARLDPEMSLLRRGDYEN